MIQPDLLLEGYSKGIFPMAMENGEIGWFSPDPRAIIPLEHFHVPHGLKRVLRKRLFQTRLNHAFSEVMHACANREETWISEEIIASYCSLHRLGFAHSFEAWQGGHLVGGLYGVSLGAAFFGESMFHLATDASKVALHFLVQTLRNSGFQLLEVQWLTSHLETFGATNITRRDYLARLAACLNGVAPRRPLVPPEEDCADASTTGQEQH